MVKVFLLLVSILIAFTGRGIAQQQASCEDQRDSHRADAARANFEAAQLTIQLRALQAVPGVKEAIEKAQKAAEKPAPTGKP